MGPQVMYIPLKNTERDLLDDYADTESGAYNDLDSQLLLNRSLVNNDNMKRIY